MSSRNLRQFLASLYSAGVRYVPQVELSEPVSPRAANRRAAARPSGSRQPASRSSAATASRPQAAPVRQREADFRAPVQIQQPSTEVAAILQTSQENVLEKQAALLQLKGMVSKCDRCSELAAQRRHTVFGTGNADARIMFVGEAPGADEDISGEPFVGAAGQLLDKIIVACGLTREEIYICNILRCRPPGNRNPLPQESANCREYLDAQISIVKPEYIVCWGTIAAQNLLAEQRSVGKLRGSFHSHANAKVLCTYHPSYLLRYPQQKKEVWTDMKILMADMGIDL